MTAWPRFTDTVLEVSIGTGRNLKYLNPRARYFGVDISSGMLKRCQNAMRRRGVAVCLLQAQAECLPLADESFDVVCFHQSRTIHGLIRYGGFAPNPLYDEQSLIVLMRYYKNH